MTFGEFIQHFPGKRVKIKDGFNVQCPCSDHDDRNPSLSITNGGNKILIKCHAGCNTEDILKSIGLEKHDLFYNNNGHTQKKIISEIYDYKDLDGTLLFQSVRYNPKEFNYRKPDGRGGWIWNMDGVKRVLYRLPELVESVEKKSLIYIVEGEKDVNALIKSGVAATCNPMGAGKWLKEYSEYLQGADIVIIPDRDIPGQRHGQQVAKSLQGVATSIRIVELPYAIKEKHGNDVYDYLKEYTIFDLGELADKASIWEPSPSWFKLCDPLIEPVPNLEFVIEGYAARGMITVLGGAAGSGKSLLNQVFLSRRDDRLLQTEPGIGIYLSGADSSEFELRRRARLIGVNYGMRTVALPEDQYCVVTNETFRDELLNQAIRLNADAIVFDTLADFHNGNLYEAELANLTMRRFTDIARKGNLACILITHTRKGSKEKPEYTVEDIADSRVFGTKADFVFGLKSEYQKDGCNLIELQCLKSRSAKPLKPLRAEIFMDDIVTNELAIKRSTRFFKNEVEQQGKEERRLYLINETHRLKSEGKSYRDIANELGISLGSVTNYGKQTLF